MNDRRAPHCTAANDPWLREAVGAYLLGALEPAENDRVAAHLAGCASCRAEYGELAELLPLLASAMGSLAVLANAGDCSSTRRSLPASSRRSLACFSFCGWKPRWARRGIATASPIWIPAAPCWMYSRKPWLAIRRKAGT